MSTQTGGDDTPDEPTFGRSFRLSHTYRSLIYRTGLYGSMTVLFVILGFPIYWMAQNAFKTRLGLQEGITFFPTPDIFTVQQFDVIFNPTVGRYLLNSVIVTIGVVVTVIVVSLIAGYGLARFNYKHKVKTARFLLVGYMFSPIVLAIPLYLIWDTLGLLNRYVGLILALSAMSMPFAVWLMWKYIQTIPASMEESAWVAGAPRWRGFLDVIVPQTKPAMIANSVFAFAIAWGDFTFAYILMPDDSATTFPPGIFRLFHSSWETGWPEFMAVSLLVSLPALLFAFFLQSYLLKGFKIRAL
ncbi:multiple sugar transport system permease protein [Natronorubrum sediminis]|uniref:Multiple sugar transport system permease protein n=1 Tax=Natronorubrum sediminis TaxID=640943 RepID=A0A1H6FZJ7_9EURY|nr:carbohydrate ABC transporter permease [Natronorubrum sediminis]SEH15125.1 multiple sugar transport system permease protein [Natronorubrum sediminis]